MPLCVQLKLTLLPRQLLWHSQLAQMLVRMPPMPSLQQMRMVTQ